MAVIQDFECKYGNSVGVSAETTERLNLVFPDAYLHADSIVAISKEIREHDGGLFCHMPFDHTLEADAMGANINYGNEKIGPRAAEYMTETIEDLLELPEINFESGRMAQNVEACRRLSEAGENVLVEMTGPHTILNMMIDPIFVFKAMRKKPEVMQQIFDFIAEQLLRYADKMIEAGAKVISYADPTGGVNILGPKMSETMVHDFTYDFLKKLVEVVDRRAVITLCPKTMLALVGTELAELEPVSISSMAIEKKDEYTYEEACLASLGKLDILGHTCVKDIHFVIRNDRVQSLVFK
ncbi:MAG: uroporphyrinogen decarboxylase family protein [Firmicutes bacterium]|nr:uroporphyrinogen decarboxylase family protein [Bacillota bacterium]